MNYYLADFARKKGSKDKKKRKARNYVIGFALGLGGGFGIGKYLERKAINDLPNKIANRSYDKRQRRLDFLTRTTHPEEENFLVEMLKSQWN